MSDPPYFVCEDPIRVREPFINIERVGVEGTVIATMEVLSPTNKDSSNPGNALYKQKQREVLGSSAHLVEIDLLRKGQHTVAASRTILNMHGPWHYVVCLHRAGLGLSFETWPVSIRERLPRFLVPLAEGDTDIVLDLQAVLQRCYDDSGYARDIDYREDPMLPIDPEDAAWADALLREKGLRPKRRRPGKNGGRS